MSAKTILLLAAILGGTGVAIGAFAAHSLEKIVAGQELSPAEFQKRKDWMETGARYQLVHAVALLSLAAWAKAANDRRVHCAAICICLGVVVFSGCLHVMSITGFTKLGAVVPIGGVLMIVGWTCLGVSACRSGEVRNS